MWRVDWGELPDWGKEGTTEILQAPDQPRRPEARWGAVEKGRRVAVPGVRVKRPPVSLRPEGTSGLEDSRCSLILW